MERFKVAIVIPAYNEESTISEVVKSVLQYGDAIVVNDASSDCTEKKALQAGAIIVNNETNCGYDKTLNNGFIEADRRNYDAVITFDADGQHNPVMLTEYVEYLKNGKDLVLGIRAKPARIAELLFMKSTQIYFNWKDPLCGMKGYSMKIYRDQGYFDSYGSIGTQLSIFGLLNRYSYVQLPINILKRKDKSRFYSAFLSNFSVLRLFIRLCLL
mgnify:CR=1 FL=1